jgi:hypothetical protein
MEDISDDEGQPAASLIGVFEEDMTEVRALWLATLRSGRCPLKKTVMTSRLAFLSA